MAAIWDLVTVSYHSRVLYPREVGLLGNSNHLRPVYFSKEEACTFTASVPDQESSGS